MLVKNLAVIISFVISLLLVSKNYAGSRPTNGILYNSKEVKSLIYSCEMQSDSTLICEFKQVGVRKKLDDNELSKKKADKKQAAEYVEECLRDRKQQKDFLKGISMLDSIVKNSKNESEANKAAITAKAFRTCSQEDMAKLIELNLEEDNRTCVVSGGYDFTQSFRLVSDNSGSSVWTVIGAPSGDCGIVQASRFEPDRSVSSKWISWNYLSKKTITNKKGKTLFGLSEISCKDLDENEYAYSWKSETYPIRCDKIEFSPL